jgi:DNA primase
MITVDKVKEWIKVNKLAYWRIVDSKDSEFAHWKNFAEKDGEPLPLATSLELFEQNAQLLPNGSYFIFGKKNTLPSEKEVSNRFFVGEQIATINAPFISNQDNGVVNALSEKINQLQAQIERKELEQKHREELREKEEYIKRLRREMTENKVSNQDRIMGFLEAVILPKFMPQPPKTEANNAYVNQQPQENQSEKPENLTLIENAFAQIQQLIGEQGFYDLMLKLGDFANTNPDNFKKYMAFIVQPSSNGVHNN